MNDASNQLHIHLLGSLRVMHGDAAITSFRSDAQRVLLAYLAANQGTPQRRDALAALLTPDRDNKAALKYLRNRLDRLRQTIGDREADPPYLYADRKVINLLAGNHLRVDSIELSQVIAEVKQHRHSDLHDCLSCYEQLETVATLCRGELLAGLHYPSDLWQTWLLGQRERLTQEMLWVLQTLGEICAEREQWHDALRYGQQQLVLEPWLESAHQLVIEAHQELDDRMSALSQFQRCAAALRVELGMQPTSATRRLAGLTDKPESSGAVIEKTIVGNLPAAGTPFFGRKSALHDLSTWLIEKQYRLVTLVGMGGIGKTRLALEVAQHNAAFFDDGAWFVSLAGIAPNAKLALEAQIADTIVAAVGLERPANTPAKEILLSWLKPRNVLLVLDNWEQILDGAEFLLELTKAAASLTIICTSRTPLDFQMERVFAVDGLPVPDDESANTGEYDSVHLFLERAQRVATVDSAELPTIGALCNFVQGHPLAIELAAAALRHESLADLVSSLEESAEKLAVTFRDMPARQRSIEATFQHSWSLLSPHEQKLFAQLSIFRGGFERDAARTVVKASDAGLRALQQASLIVVSEQRYSIHPLLLGYGEAQLQQLNLDEIANRHSHHYLHWLQTHDDELLTSYGAQFLDQIAFEFPNVRRAWLHGIETASEENLLVAFSPLSNYLQIRSQNATLKELFFAGYDKFKAAGMQRLEAYFSNIVGFWHQNYGEHEQAEAMYARAMEIGRNLADPELETLSIFSLLDYKVATGNAQPVDDLYQRGVALASRNESGHMLVSFHIFQAATLIRMGKYGQAADLLDQATQLAQQHDLIAAEMQAAIWSGYTHFELGNMERVKVAYERAIELSHIQKDVGIEYTSVGQLSDYYMRIHQYDIAIGQIDRAIELAEQVNLTKGSNVMRYRRARLFCHLGKLSEAQTEFEQVNEFNRGISSSEVVFDYAWLGKVHFYQANYEEAKRYWLLMLETAQKQAQVHFEALAAVNLARHATTVMQAVSATEWLAYAQACIDKQPYPSGESDLAHERGQLALLKEEWPEAESYFRDAQKQHLALSLEGPAIEDVAGIMIAQTKQGKSKDIPQLLQQIRDHLSINPTLGQIERKGWVRDALAA